MLILTLITATINTVFKNDNYQQKSFVEKNEHLKPNVRDYYNDLIFHCLPTTCNSLNKIKSSR